MKTSITPNPKPFQPLTLSITFESEDELMAFGAVFNVEPVCNALQIMCPELRRIRLWDLANNHNTNYLSSKTVELESKLKSHFA